MTLVEPIRSYTQGYALCRPGRRLLGHSYRPTAAEAIASTFTARQWRARQTQGWTVEPTYALVFAPKFFPTVPAEPEAEGPSE